MPPPPPPTPSQCLQLSWITLCLLSTWASTALVLARVRSKPPLRLLLLDLVHRDLALVFAANATMLIGVYWMHYFGLAIPTCLAYLASFAMNNSSVGFLVYLAVGSIIQVISIFFTRECNDLLKNANE